MSPAVAWAVTGLCIAAVLACLIVLFMRRQSSLRRVTIVMGVTLAIDIVVSQYVPWALMWLPLFASHLTAAWVVTTRPANRVHAAIGGLYAVMASIDATFALYGNQAAVWSLYMDLINVFTIAQVGVLLTGVLSDGRRNTRRSRSFSRTGGHNIQGAGDIGFSR